MISPSSRFILERLIDPGLADTLADDVRRGLFSVPKRLPPKHLYDAEGSRLFEEICTLEEYYPTRTETALLARIANELIDTVRPATLVEMGSGSATKTRLLLDAMARLERPATYVPVDIDESVLAAAAPGLLETYPLLSVRALLADFERPLHQLPRGRGVLVAFLGGTIGNLEESDARAFLARLARAVGPGASLLLGIDRVKQVQRLQAAYDDARGVTARFNLNLLRVLNRRLGADFLLEDFRHRALYDPAAQQVEMHLVAQRSLVVRLRELDRVARFQAGESVRTEISRKFTSDTARALIDGTGWHIERLFDAPGPDFSLIWASAGPGLEDRSRADLASPTSFP
ncbi:MAG: L-histidine N(alpha)-methyltransferase [Deltaproteobacteria bacterium]|nr:L-histidine N(alpha)-methyltransferase [Deltaproteobacteria bacterium]